ncbi:ATP-dependent DNA helicase [Sporanaerobium hydrogeniformans]|uniref:ATP-dependent DNA helicase n=1 Tax=Sporanaerobium hydrogeniformans TaxID=3072179 RepID=A0AC61DD58_9FIRM|nr:ATP-dependent helicase [Sporanaerobium hydrogeniformans]PHV70673.1 ATP-dependent DNA helicase [Sporanaerobium hydrogeniformans]
MNLNENQLQAVKCPLGPTIVIAGPGSGKTQVIIQRLYHMITHLHCSPQSILVVTFSKLAALEMRERYIKSYGASSITFGTLHSVFYRLLRQYDPLRYDLSNLLSEDEKKKVIQKLYIGLEAEEYEDFVEEFLRHLTLMKNQLIEAKHYYPDGLSRELFLKLYQQYEQYKERHQKFDFDDMLVHCYFLLKQEPSLLQRIHQRYHYLLIDEFQDINVVQFEIIKQLTGDQAQLFVVGDDDQSIYKFRGSKPEFLLDFKKHFQKAHEIYLSANYRCSGHIVHYSSALISANKTRYPKELTTPNPLGPLPQMIDCKTGEEQAQKILEQLIHYKEQGQAWKEMAVIYRTNLGARPIVQALLQANIPFCLRDGMMTLYHQWVTQDILAYLKLAQNPQALEQALRIINKPKRYISKSILARTTTLPGSLLFNLLKEEELSEWQRNYIDKLIYDLQLLREKKLKEGITYIRHTIGYDNYITDYASYRKIPVMPLFEVLDEIEESAQNFSEVISWEAFLKEMAEQIQQSTTKQKAMSDVLTLTTMHGSKGLEFQSVFILDVIDGVIPHQKSSHDIEEERRLLYVAMTRARENLLLYIPSEKHGKPVTPSPFIAELRQPFLANYFKVGHFIYHRALGRGKIIEVQDNYLLLVRFKGEKIRKIDGNYCLNNGIIRWEEE